VGRLEQIRNCERLETFQDSRLGKAGDLLRLGIHLTGCDQRMQRTCRALRDLQKPTCALN